MAVGDIFKVSILESTPCYFHQLSLVASLFVWGVGAETPWLFLHGTICKCEMQLLISLMYKKNDVQKPGVIESQLWHG